MRMHLSSYCISNIRPLTYLEEVQLQLGYDVLSAPINFANKKQ